MSRRALTTLAATLTATVAFAAAAAGARGALVEVRVDASTGAAPVLDATVETAPHPVDGGDGSGAHPCSGNGSSPAPTATGALDDAMRAAGIAWRGNWDPSFRDFFIDRIGPYASAPPDQYWSLTVNGRFSSGGCLATVADGDVVHFQFGSLFGEPGTLAPPPGEPGVPGAGGGGGGPSAAPTPSPVTHARARGVAAGAARYLRRHRGGAGADWGRLALAVRRGRGRGLEAAAAALLGPRLDVSGGEGRAAGDESGVGGGPAVGGGTAGHGGSAAGGGSAAHGGPADSGRSADGGGPAGHGGSAAGGGSAAHGGPADSGRSADGGGPAVGGRSASGGGPADGVGTAVGGRTADGVGTAAHGGPADGGGTAADEGRRRPLARRGSPTLQPAIRGWETRGRNGGGRRPLARRRARGHGDGSLDGDVNATAIAVLALRGSDSRRARTAARWLARVQGADGGFGFRPGVAADVDSTALAAWALARAGRGGPAHRAAGFVAAAENADGGFPSLPGGESNAQSTGLALVALRVAGPGPRLASSAGATPLDYLASLARPDGSIEYAPGSHPTPTWTSAQALLGLTSRGRLLATPAAVGGGR